MFTSVTTGVVTGCAGCVMGPIVGIQRNGAIGLASGIGLGAVGAVLLPVSVCLIIFDSEGKHIYDICCVSLLYTYFYMSDLIIMID